MDEVLTNGNSLNSGSSKLDKKIIQWLQWDKVKNNLIKIIIMCILLATINITVYNSILSLTIFS